MKVCNRCRESKHPDDFYANPAGRGGLRPGCMECTKARRKQWYAQNSAREVERVRRWALANPEKAAERVAAAKGSPEKKLADRKSYLKRKYGMTIADYDRMLDDQGGVCAICGEPRPQERTLHVDDDHTTGMIRGLLCFRCNNALGDFREQHELFRRAAEYLDRDDELDGHVRARAGALGR